LLSVHRFYPMPDRCASLPRVESTRDLEQLAANHQVLCVTHLPQIASFADHHYRVEKRELRGRTVAEIEELDSAARTREIGRMLSGQKVTPEALKHAEQLIRLSAPAEPGGPAHCGQGLSISAR
jgi:hypothetical protein